MPPTPSASSAAGARGNLAATPWYRFQKPTRPIRLGLLLPPGAEGLVPRWLANALEELVALPEFSVVAVFEMPGTAAAPPPPPPPLLQRFSAWSRAGAADLLEPVTCPATPSIEKLSAGLEPIRAAALDVLLLADSGAGLTGDCTNLAHWGVWSFLIGDPRHRNCQLPFWREAREEDLVVDLRLLRHDTTFEQARVLDRIELAASRSLRFTQDQVTALGAAGALLGWCLTQAAAGELPEATVGESVPPAATLSRWPSDLVEVAPFIAKKVVRSAFLRLADSRGVLKWSVGIRPRSPRPVDFSNPLAGEAFREVPSLPGECLADPFPVEHDGHTWLFVERIALDTGLGWLGCMEVHPDGTFGEPFDVERFPFHSSYPHVIASGGEFFYIPETCADKKVRLYRATHFPFEWKLERVLMDGIGLVDTTPYFHEGKWYFFTSTDPTIAADQGYLFTADSIDGDWCYHPANPIVKDSRIQRGAGAVFEQDGRLYRPTQDCSRMYGYAVNFMEIQHLSPSRFEQRRVGGFSPADRPGSLATHTFNRSAHWEVIDWWARVPAPRA